MISYSSENPRGKLVLVIRQDISPRVRYRIIDVYQRGWLCGYVVAYGPCITQYRLYSGHFWNRSSDAALYGSVNARVREMFASESCDPL